MLNDFKIKILILSLSINLSFSTYLFAQQMDMQSDQQVVQEKIDQWYNQIGFDQSIISKSLFKTAVTGFFKFQRGRGLHPNVMGIVNYMVANNQDRFVIFQIGPQARMLYSMRVAHGHGKNPAVRNAVAHKFSNQPGSQLSSLGFITTSGSGLGYGSKFGKHVNLIGLESRNSNIARRAIFIHTIPGFDLSKGEIVAWSEGCLAIPNGDFREVAPFLANKKVLIYLAGNDSSGEVTSNISKSDVESVSAQSAQPVEPLPPRKDIHDNPRFSSAVASTPAVHGTDKNSINMDWMSSIGQVFQTPDEGQGKSMTNPDNYTSKAPIKGTESFADCQSRARNCPWEKVVDIAKMGGDPSYCFRSSYIDIVDNQVDGANGVERTDGELKELAIKNRDLNNNCIALARTQKYSDFTPVTGSADRVTSQDKNLQCLRRGVEDQQWTICKQAVKEYDQSKQIIAQKKADDLSSFKQHSSRQAVAYANSNDKQMNASSYVEKSYLQAGSLENEKGNITKKLAIRLNQLQASFPTEQSIMEDCKQYMQGRNFGQADLQAVLDTLDLEDKRAPVQNYDHCEAVKRTMHTDLLQNYPAQKQLKKIVESYGIEALDHYDKSAKLKVLSGVYGGVNKEWGKYHNQSGDYELIHLDKKFVSAEQWSKDKKLKMTMSKGTSRALLNQVFYGSDKKQVWSSSYAAPQEISPMNIPQYYFSMGQGYNQASMKRNVFLALSGKISPLSLSLNQRYEYNKELYKLQNSKHSTGPWHKGILGKRKIKDSTPIAMPIEDQMHTNVLIREIWFNKQANLFQIISNRYRRKFLKE